MDLPFEGQTGKARLQKGHCNRVPARRPPYVIRKAQGAQPALPLLQRTARGVPSARRSTTCPSFCAISSCAARRTPCQPGFLTTWLHRRPKCARTGCAAQRSIRLCPKSLVVVRRVESSWSRALIAANSSAGVRVHAAHRHARHRHCGALCLGYSSCMATTSAVRIP